MLHANIDGVAAVIRAAASAGVGRVVHTSSAATIGEPEGVVAREDTSHRGWFLSDYERSKFLGERRALDLGTTLGIDVVSVNPSSVQGPGRIERLGPPADRPREREAPGAGRHAPVDRRHRRLHPGPPACRDARRGGPALPRERRDAHGAPEAVRLLRDACGSPKRARYAPRSVITLAGAFGGVLTWLSHRDIPLCSEATRVLLHGHRYDGSLAERELGLTYTPVEETSGARSPGTPSRGSPRRCSSRPPTRRRLTPDPRARGPPSPRPRSAPAVGCGGAAAVRRARDDLGGTHDDRAPGPQPRDGARPRDRGRGARRRPLDRPRRQDRGRRRRRRRDAADDRHRLDGRRRRDRRGREGRGADALQRRGRRQRRRSRRSTSRSTRSTAPRLTAIGQPNAARGDRARRTRHDVLPGRGRLHGEGRGRPRGGRRDRHHGPARRERPSRREGQGHEARGGHGDDPRPAATRRDHRRDPRGRRSRLPDHATATSPARSSRPRPRARASTCCSGSAARPRA